MKFIADFHIHSHFSLATSKELTPVNLHKWALLKGITVVGTGDFTHPGWVNELEDNIEPAEDGLYKLKNELINNELKIINPANKPVRFILTAEVSSIYKKKDKVRKVHNLLFAPSIEVVRSIQKELTKIGNITSDGRPILGLDCKNLLDLILNVSSECFLVPAHIWTPWFSVLGSKSGFDSIHECFEDLTDNIFAIETGLSSDPVMNWMCSFLDKFAIISNSDAHNPENLGREGNIFNTDLSYNSIKNALKYQEKNEFLGTLEFFAQEGKYHYDGHRKCSICWNPLESIRHGNICPVCGKQLTLGVMYRVAELADREDLTDRPNRNNFNSIIPLKEILSEIYKVGANSKAVRENYLKLLNIYNNEFDILLYTPYDELKKFGNSLLVEAIQRMREGRVFIQEGYDGEYGKIKVFNKDEENDLLKNNLFSINDTNLNAVTSQLKTDKFDFDIHEFRILREKRSNDNLKELYAKTIEQKKSIEILNQSQEDAASYLYGPSLIIAGPGTGKTKTLSNKIIKLINSGVKSENILALTFSNQAAHEIQGRIKSLINDNEIFSKLTISTFHGFGLSIIDENITQFSRARDYSIINDHDKELILKEFTGLKQSEIKKSISTFSNIKQHHIKCDEVDDEKIKYAFTAYNDFLKENNLFDFDDLLYLACEILQHSELLANYKNKHKYILIDEYQDINLIQYELVRLLAAEQNANITAIGDPNQAIYSFRGASIRFINTFIIDYPKAKVFQLEKSYRCTDNILEASNQIITSKSDNNFFLHGVEQGIKININEYATDKTEAEFIARQIESMIGGLRFFSIDSGISDGQVEPLSLSDFVVLCRIGKQMDAIEKAFKDHSIPYQKIGETPFYKEEFFLDIIDIIRVILFPNNKLYKTVFNRLAFTDIDINNINDYLNKNKLLETIKHISENYFRDKLEKYKNNFDLLFDMAKDYNDNPLDFIKFIESSSPIDIYRKNTDCVKLMTMHSAKGLEFECVFISGCCDKLIPFSLYPSYTVDLEEEKRLLYVSMTRAKKYLYLTYSKKINFFGQAIKVEKSPFIDKIKSELINFEKQKAKEIKEEDDKQLNLF